MSKHHRQGQITGSYGVQGRSEPRSVTADVATGPFPEAGPALNMIDPVLLPDAVIFLVHKAELRPFRCAPTSR